MSAIAYTPRPRSAVASLMVALHHVAGVSVERERWLVELLEIAMYRTWREWS